MLRWSSESTGRQVDLLAIARQDVDALVPGGRELAALARTAAVIRGPDPGPASEVARVLDDQAATDAAAVAAAFEGFNRIVDATGLPVGRAARRDLTDLIEMLGLMAFPHADHGA